MDHTPTRHNMLIVLVIGALLACYAGVLAGIVQVWSTNYLYSYGFAVPLISAYMLWARSETLRRTSRQPDYLFGSLVTATGATLLLAGHLAAVESIEAASLLVTVCGVT